MLLAVDFAGVALFLAALGIYGVLAYQVSQRRQEIGIRMALGSDASGIFRMVLGEGMVLLAVGFAAGLALAVAARGGAPDATGRYRRPGIPDRARRGCSLFGGRRAHRLRSPRPSGLEDRSGGRNEQRFIGFKWRVQSPGRSVGS